MRKIVSLFLKWFFRFFNFLEEKKILKLLIFWHNFFFLLWFIYNIYIASKTGYNGYSIWDWENMPKRRINIVLWIIECIVYYVFHPVVRAFFVFIYSWITILGLTINFGYIYYKYHWSIFVHKSKIKYFFYVLFWFIHILLFFHFTEYVFIIYSGYYSMEDLPKNLISWYHNINGFYFIISVTVLIAKLLDSSGSGKKPYKKRAPNL